MANQNTNIPGSMLELTIDKLVPGGDGLARHDGKVYFVPFSVPGERVRVRIVEAKMDFARAVVVEVLEPSPDRTAPGCPVFGRCGGCDWQHLSHEAQLRHKVSLAEDALRRMGGISFPGLAIEGGKPWRYRNRVQVHQGQGGKRGFLARASHDVIKLADCPIARPAFGDLFVPPAANGPAPQPAFSPEGRSAGPGRHTAWSHPLPDGRDFLISEEPGATGHGVILSGASGDGPEPPAADARAAIIREAAPAYMGPLPAGSDGPIEVSLLGKTIRFDLRCFFQSNLEMTARLIPWALDGLKGESALDLYCGVGLFGAFLADRYKSVLAVEENPISLEYAQGNIGATHDFLRGRVEDLLLEERGPLASARPECIVVDPPRTGLDKAVAGFLAEKRPADLIYVSCNPVTLARDLKGLLAAGFSLADLRLFDFYPQTAHVEAVAKLKWVGPIP